MYFSRSSHQEPFLTTLKQFGLSNFLPAQVQEVYTHCKSQNYVLPTIYEGHYNPISRHAETALLPLLRDLGISFYAYGALAGGFLTKSEEFFEGMLIPLG